MEETYHLFAEYQNIPSSQITMDQSDLLQIAHSPSDLHGKPMQSGYRKAGPQLRLTQAFQKWAQRGEFCDLGDIKQITQDRENIETLHFSPYQTGTRIRNRRKYTKQNNWKWKYNGTDQRYTHC